MRSRFSSTSMAGGSPSVSESAGSCVGLEPARYCEPPGRERSTAMFGLGYQELLIILVIVLILFGANRLPELARSLGSSVKEFKKGVTEPQKDDTSAAAKREEGKKAYPPSSASTSAAPGSASGPWGAMVASSPEPKLARNPVAAPRRCSAPSVIPSPS